MIGKERTGPTVLLVTIFVINFLSLVYQVVWTRKIMVIFGTSALSISTVLSVFLAGIALGGYYGGDLIRKVRRKYLFTGLALMALGVYCLASVYIFGLVKYPFLWLSGTVEDPLAVNLIKFFLSAIILIFPTTIIGAMFPVVTHLYSVEFRRLGKDVASIYSLDTFGAALGAAICGFMLVPVLGLAATSALSASLYVILGFVLTMMEGRGAVVADTDTEDRKTSVAAGDERKLDGRHRLLLAALFVSGFSALVLEVAWSKYFHLLFGTSIYAFALVIAAFLTGLSVGSYVIKKLHDRIANPTRVFGFIMILIAGTSMVVVQTTGLMESLYMYLYHSTGNFYVFQAGLFVAAFLLMLVPTSLMGANFPLAIRMFARTEKTRAGDTGLLFSVNTAGGILGAFAAGFFIVPHLGLEKTGIMAAVLYLLLGFVFLVALVDRRVVNATAAAALTAAFFFFGYATYGEPDLDISVYYNGIRKKSYDDYARIKSNAHIVFSEYGLYGRVAVEWNEFLDNMALWTNGKVDASTAKNDMQNQDFLGHLPLLFHKKPEKVLNIGFGSGVTAGAVVSHDDVVRLDCVELDPLVVKAAGTYFKKVNNDVLADPRVKVHYEDGRHWLYTSKEKYDVIISEPSNIWISGVSQLFTREFYKIADDHLSEGGIFTQWLPAYDLMREDLLLIVKTLSNRFEHIIYWTNLTDIILLASHEPFTVDYDYINSHMEEKTVVTDIRKAIPKPDFYNVSALLDDMVSTETELIKHVRDYGHVNTDDLNYLEFNTVKNSFIRGHKDR